MRRDTDWAKRGEAIWLYIRGFSQSDIARVQGTSREATRQKLAKSGIRSHPVFKEIEPRKLCEHCGKRGVGFRCHSYCKPCSQEAKKSPYTFYSEEYRQHHNYLVRRWQANHPERAKEIQNRATANWRKRNPEKFRQIRHNAYLRRKSKVGEREKGRQRERRYYHNHKHEEPFRQRDNERSRRYYRRHREEIRQRRILKGGVRIA